MGILYDSKADESLLWQIEVSGSWQWEISDADKALHLALSGPTEAETAGGRI